MIGRLRGTLLEKQAPDLVVDAHGVGYELQAPLGTVVRLPPLGQEVVLYTHFVVREDAQQLFGFWTREERELFRALIRVSGVGPKMALAILSGMEADDFVLCVQRNDTSALVRVPGVGKKTAERLIVEMRDRVGALTDAAPGTTVGRAPTPGDALADAMSGLIALGYKPQEASRLVHGLDTEGKSSEAIIREVLRGLAKA